MRNIRYIHRLYVVMLVSVFALTACNSMLDETPLSFVDKKQFYKDEKQCIAALNACYTDMTSIFTHNLFKVNEGSTDLAYLISDDEDTSFAISPANAGVGSIIWTSAYHGVMVCNSTIDGIEGAPLSDERKKSLIAEAVTLRALYYYVLTSMFGDIPFYRDDISDLDVLDRIAQLGRMSAVDTRNTLIEELSEYVSSLPKKSPMNVEGNRVSAPLAYILIAKMAMWNKDYDTAAKALEEIKTIYGSLLNYSLQDTYFRYKNTAESILEVQFTWSATGLRKTTIVSAYCLPPRVSGTDIYNGVSIPELGDKANPSTSLTPSDHLLDLYKENLTDLRKEIITASHYNGQWFTRPASNNFQGKPWMGPKFWCPGMDNKLDGNNQKVFRYADALLMAAECYNELGKEEEALKNINIVRIRANTPSIADYPGKDELFEEIKNERARELMGEYGRKWDLVRWGIFYDAVKETIAKENPKVDENIRPYHEYYPIPDDEVFKSKGKLTNDAYKAQ